MSGTRHFTCDKGETFARTIWWATQDLAADPERTVTDAVTNATTTLTSATAAFTSGDVGREVTGTRIPARTYISAYTSATQITLSAAATGSGTGGTLTIASTRRADLTSYTAKLQIRRNASHEDVLLELTDTDGLTLGGTAGTITIEIPAADTLTLPAGTWVYDLRLTSGSGTVKYLLAGDFQVIETVTA